MTAHVFIVIPMLNEQETLTDTCASLGAFREASDRHFVLVDNGSTDRTWSVALEIQAKSRHRVDVIREDERGHVPPRRRGCRFARELAHEQNWPLEQIVICQGDADTIYDDEYIPQMLAAMTSEMPAIYEGRSILRGDNNPLPVIHSYLRACEQTDHLVESCFAPEQTDVIVDDKVAAYRLSDYLRWGGHRREYSSRGDELLAETTRLYMRAHADGALRVYVNDALARHSVRRILAETWMHFASAGFPRETSWRERYRSRQLSGELTGDADAVRTRLHHLLGLFSLLPAHVEGTREGSRDQRFINLLPARNVAELRSAPGVFLDDVLTVVDTRGDELAAACQPTN